MIAHIADHRAACGVEPICRVLRIAPSTCHAHAAGRADPAKASARSRREAELCAEIRRVQAANFGVYGVRKVWRQFGREGTAVARCTVARMPWSRRCTTGAPSAVVASSITATGGRNTWRSATPSALPTPGSSAPSAASVTATTIYGRLPRKASLDDNHGLGCVNLSGLSVERSRPWPRWAPLLPSS
jgi:hypothetical protein